VAAWATVFVWIGANAITLYLANNVINFDRLARRFAGGDVKRLVDTRLAPGAGDLLITAVVWGWLCCWRASFTGGKSSCGCEREEAVAGLPHAPLFGGDSLSPPHGSDSRDRQSPPRLEIPRTGA